MSSKENHCKEGTVTPSTEKWEFYDWVDWRNYYLGSIYDLPHTDHFKLADLFMKNGLCSRMWFEDGIWYIENPCDLSYTGWKSMLVQCDMGLDPALKLVLPEALTDVTRDYGIFYEEEVENYFKKKHAIGASY